MIVFALFLVVVGIVIIAGTWMTFTKAGKPGWACIVPIYNLVVMCEIAECPMWYILLIFIPLAGGLIFSFMTCLPMAEKFGKTAGFGVGLALLPFIFFPILGFGDAKYLGGVSRRSAYGYED